MRMTVTSSTRDTEFINIESIGRKTKEHALILRKKGDVLNSVLKTII